MASKFQYAIFDLDGTLLDTLVDLMNAVNFALEKYGQPPRTYEEIRHFVGNGIRNLVLRSVADGTTEEEFEYIFWTFKEYYSKHSQDNTKPYDGVLEVLEWLKEKGVPTAIVSNKIDSAVKQLCEDFFTTVDFAVGEREGVPRKPAPDNVLWAMENLGADPNTTVYIGDSEVDVLTAKNSNLPCLSVLWGFRSREEVEAAGGTTFVSEPEQLKEYF